MSEPRLTVSGCQGGRRFGLGVIRCFIPVVVGGFCWCFCFIMRIIMHLTAFTRSVGCTWRANCIKPNSSSRHPFSSYQHNRISVTFCSGLAASVRQRPQAETGDDAHDERRSLRS